MKKLTNGWTKKMLNEHDLADMCNLDKLNAGDKFTVGGDKDKLVFKIKSFIGDYAYCYDGTGEVHHFANWTKVRKV